MNRIEMNKSINKYILNGGVKEDEGSTSEVDINKLSNDEIFNFMELYFDRYNVLFGHLYNSFNKFLDEDVVSYLKTGDHTFFEKMTAGKVIKYKFKYDKLSIKAPTMEGDIEPMFPTDARNRNMTYSGKLLATVTQLQEITDIATGEVRERVIGIPQDNIPIANIPIMMRSKYCSLSLHPKFDKRECEYDPGGYFIVNGSEKVIICQDKMGENKPMAFIKKDSGSIIYTVQITSKSYRPHGLTQIMNVRMKKDGEITIKVPILSEINVFSLFRALGVETDKDIINMITYNSNDYDMVSIIKNSLEKCVNDVGLKIQTSQDAMEYLIGKLKVLKKYNEVDKNVKNQQKKLHLTDLLKNNFLPHIESTDNKVKAYYLGYMINKLLKCYLERIPPDDRDSYLNKRIDLPGDLLMELFKQFYRKLLNDCNKFFRKRNSSDEEPLNIIHQIKPNIIEQGIRASLSTGAWPRRKGVAQVLQRLTYLYTLTLLRRVDAPGGDASASKLTGPRQLHQSTVSFLCCVQTPEHAKVGLTKHLNLISSITLFKATQMHIIRTFLKKEIIDIRDISTDAIKNYTKVFLNGDWMGLTDEAIKLEKKLREKKLNGSFEPTTSIAHDLFSKEIRVYCDSGRMYRPVIRVENNVAKLKKEHVHSISLNKSNKDKITSWNEFMNKNSDVIEYIDMEEQPFMMLAENLNKVEEVRKRMNDSIKKVKDVTNNITNRYDDMVFVRYSHCEFHPSLLVGEIATNIPFINSNQGPRNIFYYSQGLIALCL
jgi:DNA-directed RNA polymerase II subunit RPB2